MRETYLTSREQDYLKLEEELKQDEQKSQNLILLMKAQSFYQMKQN